MNDFERIKRVFRGAHVDSDPNRKKYKLTLKIHGLGPQHAAILSGEYNLDEDQINLSR